MAGTKYFYKGMSLAKYCEENNISISTVKKRLKKLEGLEKYKDYNLDELIAIVLKDDVLLPQTKYMYNGETLMDYCRRHNISYHRVHSRLLLIKKDAKYQNLSDDELVELALNAKASHVIYYNGMPLKDYCKNNNLDYKYFYRTIGNLSRIAKYKDVNLDDLAKMVVENKTTLSPYKHVYMGESLKDYCIRNGVSYNSVLKNFHSIKKRGTFKNLKDEELMKFVIETDDAIVKLEHDKDAIEFLNDTRFSKQELIKYINVLKNNKNYKYNQSKKILTDAIRLYQHNERIREIFNLLEKGNLDQNQIDNICKELKIRRSRVDSLSRSVKPELAISVVYYFGEVIGEQKYISLKQLQKIDKITKMNVNKIDNVDLIRLYKSRLLNTLPQIFKVKEDELRVFLDIYESEHDMILDEYIREDLLSDYRFYIMDVLNNDYYNTPEMINKRLSDKKIIVDILKAEQEYREMIIFGNENIMPGSYDNDDIEDEFSDETLLMLEVLNKEEQEFINLKYKNNYSNEDLAQYYNKDVDYIEKENKKILNKLTQRANLSKRVIK